MDSNKKDTTQGHAHLSDHKKHPVIDALEQTRLSHHQEPFPHSHDSSSVAHLPHEDVVDEVLKQEEVVPLDTNRMAVNLPFASDVDSHNSTKSHNIGVDNKNNTNAAPAARNNNKNNSSKRPSDPTTSHDNNDINNKKSKSSSFSGSNTKGKAPSGGKGNQSSNDPSNRNPSPTGADIMNLDNEGDLIGLSTTATLPSATWQPLVNKSSNQLSSRDAVNSAITSSGHEFEHAKHSILPEILPGFKSRLADIHHATLTNVAGGDTGDTNISSGSTHSHTSSGSESTSTRVTSASTGNTDGARWTGGTMFPAMMAPMPSGFKPYHNSSHSHSASEDATRRLSKSSILYESSDLEESTSRLDDSDDVQAQVSRSGATHSDTLVTGGQGGRRWSHELSPEKAGLAGSVLQAAGLIKDVVLDKIQQRPTTASSAAESSLHSQFSVPLSEKEAAARVAFGGAEEAGDQNIYLDGLNRHLAQDHARSAASSAENSTLSTSVDAKGVLGPAVEAGRSVFHQSANPDVMKSLLLNHPESLGYHNRDPTLDPFEDESNINTIAGNVTGQKDLSRMRR